MGDKTARCLMWPGPYVHDILSLPFLWLSLCVVHTVQRAQLEIEAFPFRALLSLGYSPRSVHAYIHTYVHKAVHGFGGCGAALLAVDRRMGEMGEMGALSPRRRFLSRGQSQRRRMIMRTPVFSTTRTNGKTDRRTDARPRRVAPKRTKVK